MIVINKLLTGDGRDRVFLKKPHYVFCNFQALHAVILKVKGVLAMACP